MRLRIFKLSSEELGLLDRKFKYDHGGIAEMFLRRVAKQGLRHLGRNQQGGKV
jgi:hypothetical protein